jgi:hypothetical protein
VIRRAPPLCAASVTTTEVPTIARTEPMMCVMALNRSP